MTPSEYDFDQKTIELLADAVSKAINDNTRNKRFIDLERIPLICLSIANISKAIDEIKEMMQSDREESDRQHQGFVTKSEFQPYKNVLNSIGAMVLLAVVGGLLSLIFIK